ncbi:MAG: hypothetical protein HY873_10175 [Chloroflexi bacterium]|nr:hypothetical protein [Chloroflexota bacterium]
MKAKRAAVKTTTKTAQAKGRAVPRPVPRPFEMHWGGGQIVEEAAWSGPHHEPAIQLMQYEDGEAAGTASVRFCFYSPGGQFQRGALIVDEDAIAGLREALRKTPRLRALLKRLVA